jgi:hypothetical protein
MTKIRWAGTVRFLILGCKYRDLVTDDVVKTNGTCQFALHPAGITTLNKANDRNREVVHDFMWEYKRDPHCKRFKFRLSPSSREKFPSSHMYDSCVNRYTVETDLVRLGGC